MNSIIDFVGDNPVAAVIIAGEIAFWVFIIAGLVARYLLRRRRASTILLAATPLADVIVLVAAVIDLWNGKTATEVHGVAAAYLGFSVAFGPPMIRWADSWFAYRFANGPRPVKPERNYNENLRYQWREWGRCFLGCVIAAAVLLLLIFVVGTPEQTRDLWSGLGWLPRIGLICGIWLVAGPLWLMFDDEAKKSNSKNRS